MDNLYDLKTRSICKRIKSSRSYTGSKPMHMDRKYIEYQCKIRKGRETRMRLFPRFTQPLWRRYPKGAEDQTRIYYQ